MQTNENPAAVNKDATSAPSFPDKGDQALADVARSIPPGMHKIEHEGVRIEINSTKGPGSDVVAVTSRKPDGSTQYLSTAVHHGNPARPVVVARKGEWPAGRFGDTRLNRQAMGHEAWTGHNPFNREPDPETAQALKLEVAGDIESVRGHLGQAGVKAASK